MRFLLLALIIMTQCAWSSGWAGSGGGGGGSTPGGSSGTLQYNNSSALGGVTGSGVIGGNIGLNSTAPGSILDVQGTARMLGMSGITTGDVVLNPTTGNVAIGVATSTNKLTVNGTTETTGLKLTGNGVATGYVLQTNSVGVGTWVSPSSIGAGGASLWATGNVGINTTVNVGIGSVNPGQVLDVNGAIRSTAAGNSTFSGNVGIGTTVGVPSALYVVGNGFFTTGINIGIGTASLSHLCVQNTTVSKCP